MFALKTSLLTTVQLPILGLYLALNPGSTDADEAVTLTRIEIDLKPSLDGSIIDNSPFDGNPDFFSDLPPNGVSLNPGLEDSRSVVEFDLNELPPGAIIRRAQLRATVIGKAVVSTSIPIEVRAFSSNGVLNLSDFHQGRFEGVADASAIPINSTIKVDVLPLVTAIHNNSERKLVAFVLRTSGLGAINFGSLESGPAPLLKLVVAVPTAPASP
jgi:hypothetical protein